MSFVIHVAGRLDEAVRRAVHIELTRAIANLMLPGELAHVGVHEARKSFKRLRAMYRLIGAADPGAAKAEIARFRAAAATLATARDAAAMVEAFERLVARYPAETADGALAPIGAFLLQRWEAAAAGGPGSAAAVAACRAAYGGIDRFSLPRGRAGMTGLLADGLAASARRVRRALKTARKELAAEAFHTLRKRVKDHLYHLGLLRQLWPDAEAGLRRRAVDALGERLGDLNDCDVLAATVKTEMPADPGSGLALRLLANQEAELRRLVLDETARLFAEPPRKLRRSAERGLDAARRKRRKQKERPPGRSLPATV